MFFLGSKTYADPSAYLSAEQEWIAKHGTSRPILFADYFDVFVLPRLKASNWSMSAWDNLSNDWKWTVNRTAAEFLISDTAEACEKCCRQHQDCLQWFWTPGICRGGRWVRLGWAIDDRPSLGSAEERVRSSGGDDGEAVSGWLAEKIFSFRARNEPCDRNSWMTRGVR